MQPAAGDGSPLLLWFRQRWPRHLCMVREAVTISLSPTTRAAICLRTKPATRTPSAPDTRASTKAGVGSVVLSDVLIANGRAATPASPERAGASLAAEHVIATDEKHARHANRTALLLRSGDVALAVGNELPPFARRAARGSTVQRAPARVLGISRVQDERSSTPFVVQDHFGPTLEAAARSRRTADLGRCTASVPRDRGTLQGARFAGTYGRGGFRTCDLSRVKQERLANAASRIACKTRVFNEPGRPRHGPEIGSGHHHR
jgi:hypothetical protein